MQKNDIKGILLMLACAACWSIAGILITLVDLNPLVLSGLRSLIAATTVFIYMKIKKIKVIVSKRSLLNGLLLCLTFNSFITANKLTTPANAIVLQYTAPVFLMILMALIYKKRFSKADIITVIFTIIGISLFFFDQLSEGSIIGNIVAILSGAFMGSMYLFVGSGEEKERFSGVLLGNVMTAIVGLPFMLFTEVSFTPASIAALLGLGVVQLGIAYILFVNASKTCPPLACCILSALEPILNPIWVLIFLGQAPGLFALIGGVIVIVTITVWCIIDGKKKETKELNAN